MVSDHCVDMALWEKVNPIGPKPGFNFSYLWEVANEIHATDWANKSYYLYHPYDNQSRITLTYDACVDAVGTGAVNFPVDNVYDRLILWRVPLLALLATTTLPSLGWQRQVFTIVHLVADPIDTFWSLMFKLDLAARQFKWTKKTNAGAGAFFTFGPKKLGISSSTRDDAPQGIARQKTELESGHTRQDEANERRNVEDEEMKQYDLDAISRIINAYQEWHHGEDAKKVFKTNLFVGASSLFNYEEHLAN